MFNIKRKDLDYEKCMKFFLEDGEEQQMDPNAQTMQDQQAAPDGQMDPNAQQPIDQQQDPNVGMTPDQVYQQALAEMDKKIEETGRKRFQKYKMNGGNKSYKEFINDMEKKALEEIEKEMKEEFGYVPGKESEKDLLNQIKNILTDMKTTMENNSSMQPDMMDPNAQQPMDQQQMDPNAQPMQDQQAAPEAQQDPNAQQPMDQQQDPNAQPMQETLDILNENLYKKRMNAYFNYYFN